MALLASASLYNSLGQLGGDRARLGRELFCSEHSGSMWAFSRAMVSGCAGRVWDHRAHSSSFYVGPSRLRPPCGWLFLPLPQKSFRQNGMRFTRVILALSGVESKLPTLPGGHELDPRSTSDSPVVIAHGFQADLALRRSRSVSPPRLLRWAMLLSCPQALRCPFTDRAMDMLRFSRRSIRGQCFGSALARVLWIDVGWWVGFLTSQRGQHCIYRLVPAFFS